MRMIVSVEGFVEFTNGIRLDVDVCPELGITAVVGKNGSGKTFSASESVRYLLFGTKALRSTLSTIKAIDLKGTFKINGVFYTIVRTKDSASIRSDGEKKAVGSTEVNNKVIELLGYGLDVFDLCNAAVQKKTTALGDMKPSERKSLIDRLTGMESIIQIEKELRVEAKTASDKSVAYTDALPEKQPEPTMPKGYAPAKDIEAELAELRLARDNKAALEGRIQPVAWPEEPVCDRKFPEDADQTARHQRSRDQVVLNVETLERDAAADKDITHTWTDETAEDAYHLHIWECRLPLPKMSAEEFQEEAVRQQAWAETIECPSCGHEFEAGGSQKPSLSTEAFETERIAQLRWGETPREKPNEGDARLTQDEYFKVLDEIEVRQKAATARQALSVINVPQDRGVELTEVNAAIAQWDAYDSQLARAKQQEKKNEEARAALAGVPDVDNDKIERLVALGVRCAAYESAHENWQREEGQRVELLEKIAAAQKSAENFREGAEAMKRARLRLKAMLAPAISAAATDLIFDMTNGVLKSVYVDEDMTVTVDGQLLETLSGGGATVANIALRIALGRALVGNKFPVFIGDEMDGDLDDERREATIQAMVSLKEHLQQIVLITHKGVSVADNVIRIGDA